MPPAAAIGWPWVTVMRRRNRDLTGAGHPASSAMASSSARCSSADPSLSGEM